MGKKISPQQLVNYLHSNEDDVADSFGVSIADLIPAFRHLEASPALLAALTTLTKTAIRTTADIVAFEGAAELDSAIDKAWEAIAAAEGRTG